jgi:putative membrane protein
MNQLTLKQFNFDRPLLILVAVWALSMISLPIVKAVFGVGAITGGVIATVILQTTAVLWIMIRAWGLKQTAVATLIVAALTWALEAIGTATGYPFGLYDYTDKLQPQLAHVPLLIPFAWLMMLPPAWSAAALITGRWQGFRFLLVSGLALTAWDLFLDPQMVAWGFWVWREPGGYFGIPWINYGGWLLTAVLITLAVRPRPLPVMPLLIIYTITWALETIGQLFFWNLPGPAVVGGLVMGAFVILAWRRIKDFAD